MPENYTVKSIDETADHEEKRQATLPPLKYLQATGFICLTGDRPLTEEEESTDVVRHSPLAVFYMNLVIEIRHSHGALGEVEVRITHLLLCERGTSISPDSSEGNGLFDGRLVKVCGFAGEYHKILTRIAQRLDPFIPEIAATFYKDKDAAVELVKQKLQIEKDNG
jgi:hypothetical protein